jgi:hypothetical protein
LVFDVVIFQVKHLFVEASEDLMAFIFFLCALGHDEHSHQTGYCLQQGQPQQF